MLNILKLKNFKLFKEEEILLTKLNIIKGINKDDEELSSNGSGKSSILEGIIFALFGEGSGKNLQDLISFDAKSTEVNLQSTDLDIKRKIPTELTIIRQGVEIQKNTNTLKQEEINSLIGDYNFFKKYRLINKQAVNLLDLGLISLRKELMEFISADFSTIRQSLLDKKLEREKYSVSKKPYHFYLSTKRKCLLESGLIQIQDIIKQSQKSIDNQYEFYNNILIDINTKTNLIKSIDNNSLQKQIEELQNQVTEYNKYIVNLDTIKELVYEDYSSDIAKFQEKAEAISVDIDYSEDSLKNLQIESNSIKTELEVAKSKSEKIQEQLTELEEEIKNIKSLDSKSKCDKCGAKIEEKNKELFINDKIKIIKTLTDEQNTIYLETNKMKKSLQEGEHEIDKFSKELLEQKKELQITQSKIRGLNEKNLEQSKLKEKASLKDADIKKHKELIEINNKRVKQLVDLINKNTVDLEQLSIDNIKLKNLDAIEKDKLENLKSQKEELILKEKRITQYLMRLTEAFKFSEYKYTEKDIALYDASIKVIDDFAGWYIQKWLDNLAIVINNLLEKVNLSVTFSSDKNFMTIINEGQSMKYESLSSGQQCFLNCIFKIAILLNNGINDGILMLDEGINTLDKINLKKLIDVLKDLQFQTFLIYQNYDLEEDVNVITVKRENGISLLI